MRPTFRWEDREQPAEEALHYNRARTIDPSVGRWLSADPLGDAGSEQVTTHAYPRTV